MGDGQGQHLSSHVLGALTCQQPLLLAGTGSKSKAVQQAGQDTKGFCTGVNKRLGHGRLKAVLLSLRQPAVGQEATGHAGRATGSFVRSRRRFRHPHQGGGQLLHPSPGVNICEARAGNPPPPQAVFSSLH